MTKVPDDNAFQWVLEKIYGYSRWADNPLRVSASLGYGTIHGNYILRVKNILHHLQDEAKVLTILEEPSTVEESRPIESIKELLETEPSTPKTDYLIKLLPSFDDFANKSLDQSDSKASVQVSVEIVGNGLVIKVGESPYKIHHLQVESVPYKIIQYLMRYPDGILPWSKLRLEADVVNYKTSPAEFVRQLGFSGELRDIFFPVRTKTDIQFRRSLSLDRNAAINLTKILTEAKPD